MGLIISFEHVLLCDEPKQADGFIEDRLDFSIRFLGVVIRRRAVITNHATHPIQSISQIHIMYKGNQRLVDAGL